MLSTRFTSFSDVRAQTVTPFTASGTTISDPVWCLSRIWPVQDKPTEWNAVSFSRNRGSNGNFAGTVRQLKRGWLM